MKRTSFKKVTNFVLALVFAMQYGCFTIANAENVQEEDLVFDFTSTNAATDYAQTVKTDNTYTSGEMNSKIEYSVIDGLQLVTDSAGAVNAKRSFIIDFGKDYVLDNGPVEIQITAKLGERRLRKLHLYGNDGGASKVFLKTGLGQISQTHSLSVMENDAKGYHFSDQKVTLQQLHDNYYIYKLVYTPTEEGTTLTVNCKKEGEEDWANTFGPFTALDGKPFPKAIEGLYFTIQEQHPTNNKTEKNDIGLNRISKELYGSEGITGWADLTTDEQKNAVKAQKRKSEDRVSIKKVTIIKHKLELEKTNIPDGDNPIFGEKNIKLDFNYPVSEDTIYDGIKLYKDNVPFDTSEYTLEPDSTDNTVIYVRLKEFPQYGPEYKVEINNKLNKDKTGFIKLDDGYSKSITFHNEQIADLAIESTTPEDGSVHSSKQIKLDFSSTINMDSAKEHITVWKDDTQFEIDTDYTLSFEENDETVIYVNLAEMPEISTAENRIDYKVKIGTQLNSGKFGYVIFPTDYEQKTITFHNEQRTDLAVEETTPEDGSIHSSKQIKLDFSSAINMESAKEQIKVWKGDTQLKLDTDYTLNFEANDESVIYVNLAETPDLSTSENMVYYKVIVGEQLNAGKLGYTIFPEEYEQKSITFHNEQVADLAIESTTPEDGSTYASKQIKLDFSSPINMDSAKEHITVWKDNTQFEFDTDYSLSYEENDESVIYVNLVEMPDVSTSENRINYSVKVGKHLNCGKVGYAIFSTDYEQKTISFYNMIKPGKTDSEIDFGQYDESTDLSGIGITSDTPAVIGTDGEETVLIWRTRNGNGNREILKSYIEFNECFDVMEGPVEIEFTAKIPKSFMSFKVMGKDTNGDVVEFDKYVGFNNWDWTDGVRRVGIYSGVTQFKLGGSTLNNNKASTGYISYKFVIDAVAGIVKFYAREEGTENWTEQFVGESIALDGGIDNITGIQLQKNIGKPADKGGSENEMITWYIKDIKVTQVTTPAITSSTVTNAATDVSDEIESIEMGFNTSISSQAISKENIALVCVERDVETLVDESLYDVAINNDKDGIIINFNDDLGMDKKYRLKIKDIAANTEEAGKMTSEKVIEFETAKKYELREPPTISYGGAGISVVGDLRTYHKASGEDYVIMVALVNSNNEFSDIEYISPGAVPQATIGFDLLAYNLTLTKPENFNPEDYSVRIYVLNALSNSISNCKMLEFPLVSE